MSKPSREKKDEAVFVRLTRRVLTRIERAAKVDGQSSAEWCRVAALEKLRREEGRANG